ncbi:EEV maturation protein [Western grey kangaroopox virus]|uniref:EEV maturation protein n=1 Tax=Western grey kangaroopox virus TaxID=1566307 RepID=A0A2C9DSH7_9POXV|nr:EEV maturation protein [Western grey kangaroopox virus]ATI20960.1 EEV maturation protein [Western grey kangaroopox virus]
MLSFVNSVCGSSRDSRPLIHEPDLSNGREVHLLMAGGGVVFVNERNREAVRSVSESVSTTILETEAWTPARGPSSVSSFMVMEEVDTDTYFSPKSSSFPLYTIIVRMATDRNLPRLLDALLECPNESVFDTIDNTNWWLYSHDLDRYSVVSIRDARRHGLDPDRDATLVDDMVIACVGYHCIWVKDREAYRRPEISILRYDVAALADPDRWSLPRVDISSKVLVYVLEMRTYVADGDSIPCLITMYPGLVLQHRNPIRLLLDFLNHLKSVLRAAERGALVCLAGFHLAFKEIPLLRKMVARLPNGDWQVVGNKLVYKNRFRVSLLDLSFFGSARNSREYCRYWSGRHRTDAPGYFSSPEEFLRVDGTEYARRCSFDAELMHASAETHLAMLSSIFPVGHVLNFTSLHDMMFTDSIFRFMVRHDCSFYVPRHPSAVAFVEESICYETLRTENLDPGCGDRNMMVTSVFPFLVKEHYPLGRPYFTQTPDSCKLSIALCEVTRDASVTIPFLYSKSNPRACHFEGVFTSVDLRTATELGGYKIRVIGCLEWESKGRILNRYTSLIPSMVQRFKDTDSRCTELLSELLSRRYIVEDKFDSSPDSYNTILMLAFAVSYCRAGMQAMISKMDRHVKSRFVTQHSYNGLRVNSRFER